MEELLQRTSIELRTPVTHAGEVIAGLADIWEMWRLEENVDFFKHVFGTMFHDESTSGDYQIDQLQVTEEMTDWYGEPFVPGFKAAITQLATLKVACAFAVQAMKARKNSRAAWSYACEANHWLGILQGMISGRGLEREIAHKMFSNAGVEKRHAENRAMKALVMAWCESNLAKYKSLDKAAEAIAGKEVPVSFRTARAWIGEWKKLRSTGKL